MDPLIATAAAVIGIVLAVLNIREKLWPTPPKPHPLDVTLREMTSAIRELQTRP